MESSSSTDNGRRFHPLLPAPTGTNQSRLLQQSTITKVSRGPRVGACNTCRVRKIKCNGQRPTCDKCAASEAECQYVETEPREAKRKYMELRERRHAHEEMIELLKSLPEPDALEVLRKLKSGEDVQQMLDQAKGGSPVAQTSSTSRRDNRYMLPFIADMPDALPARDHDSPESSGDGRQDSESVASTAGSSSIDRSSST